ncbi:hypothetical protein GGI02_001190 [Coemansia sp. RSA 2322]|uniref:Uncharacterized protein n=1 Tax=Coemansia thaxteri TaxID=2663907 RepID=A0A9W8BDM5_9FUNG|nr:hypothetical protein H4R26_002910 [Coemansia thaxteri]KAJ2472992.1 hypothetical protein GGI02_001190 [Coemansia sp. RSA 2322]KAJ2484380.1 hypothetical protein EV174_002481 [Coemansia sp. RSA 2320]
MRIIVCVLATALVVSGFAADDASEAILAGDPLLDPLAELAVTSDYPSLDSSSDDLLSAPSLKATMPASALALSQSTASASQASSLSILLSKPSGLATKSSCIYNDGASDMYIEQTGGRTLFLKCPNGTKCFKAILKGMAIDCLSTDTSSTSESPLRVSSRHAKAKTKLNSLNLGHDYFAQVLADSQPDADIIPMSTLNLDVSLAGIPTSSEPKVISINVVLPTIAIKITEDPSAPDVATVISIDPVADVFGGTPTISQLDATDATEPVTLSRVAADDSDSRILTLTATVTTGAMPAAVVSTRVVSVTLLSLELASPVPSPKIRSAGDGSQLDEKLRHAITMSGIDISSFLRQPKSAATVASAAISASTLAPPTLPPVTVTVVTSSIQPIQPASQVQPVPPPPSSPLLSQSRLQSPPQSLPVPPQTASPLRSYQWPSSMLRDNPSPPFPASPLLSASTATAPNIFQGSSYNDPLSGSLPADAVPAGGQAYRQSKQNAPTRGIALPLPPPPPLATAPSQNSAATWFSPPRVLAPAFQPTTPSIQLLSPTSQPSILILPQASQPTPQPLPIPFPQPIPPQVIQPGSGLPMITVVMRPNFGPSIAIPVSSSPFGIVPPPIPQEASMPSVNTRAATTNAAQTFIGTPPNSAEALDSGASSSSLIIPFISNGARQAAPTNAPEPSSTAKDGEVNASGIVSILQDVFHIPPSAISIDGKPVVKADDKGDKGSASGGKGDKNANNDTDDDDGNDSDSTAHESKDQEHDLELDSRYNVGDIARSRHRVRSKQRARGRIAKTLTEVDVNNDNGDGSDDEASAEKLYSAVFSATPTESTKDSADSSSGATANKHAASVLSVILPETTLSAPLIFEHNTDGSLTDNV